MVVSDCPVIQVDFVLAHDLWCHCHCVGSVRSMTDASETRDAITDGISQGVQKSRIRFIDPRSLVLFLVVVLFVILTTIWQSHQTDTVRNQTRTIQQQERTIEQQQQQINQNQVAAKAACEQTNTTNAKFNAFIDQAIQNANNTTGLTPTQKQQTIDRYAPLHTAIVDCSKLAQ